MEGQKSDGNGNVQRSMRRLPITTAFLLLPLVAFGQSRRRQEIRDPAYRTIRTITTRRDGVQDGLILAGVQAPPLPLRLMVVKLA
jgi:hypothetical protein